MNEEPKKRKAFTMRNRYYNVICVRRGAKQDDDMVWKGEADANYNGGVSTDENWNEEEEIMP